MRELTRLLKLLLPFKWWIALAVLLAFGTLGSSVGLMAMSAYLISKAALVRDFADLAVLVTFVRAFAIARAALRYAERYITHLATFRILTRLRVWFYAAVEPLAPARLSQYHSGDLYTRIGADIETLENFYIRVIVPPLAAVLTTALACFILGAFDAVLGLMLALFLILTGIVLPLVTRQLGTKPTAQFIAARARLNTALTDTIQGLAEITAFNQEPSFVRRATALGAELDAAQMRLANLRGASNALAVLFASLAGLTILFFAIPLVTSGKIEGVFLGLLPLTAIAAFEAVQPLGAALQQLEASQGAAKRLFEIIDAPPAVTEPQNPLPLPNTFDIEFRDLRFAYDNAAAPALDGLSFRVANGERALIMGPSGAGKSTLVNLLLRFWDVPEGKIFLGGSDIRRYRADEVREILGVVSQQTFLFYGTLRDNLLVARGDATDEELMTVCRAAQLSDFISSLPLGFDTLIGENGLTLSGGERQRLAIARVLLKNAPVLILDEATANLDALTEESILHSLETFMQGRTTLIISHRRVNAAAQTIEIENGRIH